MQTHRPGARTSAPFLIACLAVAALPAQDKPTWPQWRGPDRDGISKEKDWRVEGDDQALWSARIGIGYSTVSVADGRVFTQGHDEAAQEDTVFCFDAETGKELWHHTFPAKTMKMAHKGGTLSTPSVDGPRLFALNREGRFFCFDAATGKVGWKKDLCEDFGAKMPTWGFAASPLVLEDMIVVNVGKVIAFDRSGKELWSSKRSGHAYSTPVLFEHGKKPRLAVFNGGGLVILDKKSGKELARAPWKTRYDVNAATPVVIGDRIFVSSGYGKGCGMMRFDGKKLTTLWENKDMKNHMSGCVHYEGHLYGFDESILKCLDLEGEVKWSARALGKGALVMAGDKLLVLTQRGELVVAPADPKEFNALSRVRVLERGGVQWSTPVLCGGLVYCRSSTGQLVCVDRRPAKEGGAKKGG